MVHMTGSPDDQMVKFAVHAMFACLYRPTAGLKTCPTTARRQEQDPLVAVAHDFSPRYEQHGCDAVVIDLSGVGRLFAGAAASEGRCEDLIVARTIGEELQRQAAARAGGVHVVIAATRTAALVLAHVAPGLTIVARGEEASALAPVPADVLRQVAGMPSGSETFLLSVFRIWGVRTLGEVAALPPGDLSARLGRSALVWHAIARGEDVRPLVPALEEERFESSIDLEWPIEGLEPLSFVLTRLLEPLSERLERRDRAAAVLHVVLDLVRARSAGAGGGGPGEPGGTWTRRLELPSPLREVRTLRTLVLLDLESHPPDAAIDRVTIAIDPTPGRVLQPTLFTRASPAPEQLSTLLARLGAVMGQDRIGAPAVVDSHRPGAFTVQPFRTEWVGAGDISGLRPRASGLRRQASREIENPRIPGSPDPQMSGFGLGLQTSDGGRAWCSSVLRRYRVSVPARVALAHGVPVRVTTDRASCAGGRVVKAAGPWRSSGEWWKGPWNRDEWDVALTDASVYRVFFDRDAGRWFIDAVFD
jgi:protein ImuB